MNAPCELGLVVAVIAASGPEMQNARVLDGSPAVRWAILEEAKSRQGTCQ
jgi:hypothetical protein